MIEKIAGGRSLAEAYHNALYGLYTYGVVKDCADWNCKQKELAMTMVVEEAMAEPMISRLTICGPRELQQYTREMLDGILDFEIERGNWAYTYHNRMVNYEFEDQIEFVKCELKRNPSSRRAVIDIRRAIDMRSDDPACLQHIQYFINNGKLDCSVLFRSNDACKATFMNAFALILLQNKIAIHLGVPVGSYTHRANSFHCYERDFDKLETFVTKGIEQKRLSELTYNYREDWEDLMEMFNDDIDQMIFDLQNRPS